MMLNKRLQQYCEYYDSLRTPAIATMKYSLLPQIARHLWTIVLEPMRTAN